MTRTLRSFAAPLVLGLMGALPTTALAQSDKEPTVAFYEACSYTCTSGGWELVVYEAEDIQAWKMVLMPTTATFYTSSPIGNQWEYVTNQTDVSEGGYCDMAGYYIYGSVYLVSVSSEWNSHSTDQLNGYSPCTGAGGYTDVSDWLDTLADYTTSPQWDVPEFCTDTDCLIPDGVDAEEEDHEPFTYTDASGEVNKFDDLLGEQSGGSTPKPRPSARPTGR